MSKELLTFFAAAQFKYMTHMAGVWEAVLSSEGLDPEKHLEEIELLMSHTNFSLLPDHVISDGSMELGGKI